MGAAKEWREVVLAGLFWGTFMFVWSIRRLRQENAKRYVYVCTAISWALMGLFYGLIKTFELKVVFQPPLVYLSMAALLTSVVVGRLGRPKLQDRKTQTMA